MSHSQNAKNGDNGCVNVTYEARAQPIDNKKQPKSQTIFNINSLFFAFCGPSKYRASQKGMYVFKFGGIVRPANRQLVSYSRKIQAHFSQPRNLPFSETLLYVVCISDWYDATESSF